MSSFLKFPLSKFCLAFASQRGPVFMSRKFEPRFSLSIWLNSLPEYYYFERRTNTKRHFLVGLSFLFTRIKCETSILCQIWTRRSQNAIIIEKIQCTADTYRIIVACLLIRFYYWIGNLPKRRLFEDKLRFSEAQKLLFSSTFLASSGMLSPFRINESEMW